MGSTVININPFFFLDRSQANHIRNQSAHI